MINREDNPDFINSFLDYSITILNKSPNSIKEYNYDLAMFFKFMKIHFGLTKEQDFENIKINDFLYKSRRLLFYKRIIKPRTPKNERRWRKKQKGYKEI